MIPINTPTTITTTAAATTTTTTTGEFEFTTMTYNILAECYVNAARYASCPEYARRWTYRSNQMLKEISIYSPDVLFLQVFIPPSSSPPCHHLEYFFIDYFF
jgi:mRNA deadenylase 3'-5' endonuclease subunit Ccr4